VERGSERRIKNNYIMRKFVICTFHQILYCYDEKIRIVIMDRTCRMRTLSESGNLEGRYHWDI